MGAEHETPACRSCRCSGLVLLEPAPRPKAGGRQPCAWGLLSCSWRKPSLQVFKTRTQFLLPCRKMGFEELTRQPEAASAWSSGSVESPAEVQAEQRAAGLGTARPGGVPNGHLVATPGWSCARKVASSWGAGNYKIISIYKQSFSKDGNLKAVLLWFTEKTLATGHSWHVLEKNNVRPNVGRIRPQGALPEAVIRGMRLISQWQDFWGVLLSRGMRKPSRGPCGFLSQRRKH